MHNTAITCKYSIFKTLHSNTAVLPRGHHPCLLGIRGMILTRAGWSSSLLVLYIISYHVRNLASTGLWKFINPPSHSSEHLGHRKACFSISNTSTPRYSNWRQSSWSACHLMSETCTPPQVVSKCKSRNPTCRSPSFLLELTSSPY